MHRSAVMYDADITYDADQVVRERLLSLRDELLVRCQDALEEIAKAFDVEDGMIATEYWGARVLSAIGEEADDLRDVIASIIQLDHGRYGFCRTCGEPIGGLVLAASPGTRRCDDCAVTKVMPTTTSGVIGSNAKQ
jgi:RNA polymerase-binding transcription factor DksA